MTPASVRILALPDVTGADIARWQRLAESAVESNPYLEPEYLLAIAPAWPDAADVRIAVLSEGDEWLAVFAFTVGTMTLARVTLKVARASGTFLARGTGRQHLLLHRDHAAARCDQLLAGMLKAGLPGMIELGFFPGDGPLFDALAEAATRRSRRLVEYQRDLVAFAYPTTEPAEEGPLVRGAHLSAKRRRHLEHSVAAIEAAAGDTLRHVDRTDDPSAVTDFIALQGAGWKGNAAAGGGAIVTMPGYAEAFVAMTDAFRAQGRLRVDAIEAGPRIVHIELALRGRAGEWYGLLDAYDEEFRSLGPGHLGRLNTCNEILGHNPGEWYDPCLGIHQADVFSLYPDRRPYIYAVVVNAGRVGSLRPRALLALREQAAKRHARATALAATTVPA